MKQNVLANPSPMVMNKKSQSPFEEVISSSINKINQVYTQQQLNEFNQLLNQQQPKKIKQLNIDPYMFILEHLFAKQELILFGLKQLNIIIDENYYSKTSLSSIIKFLTNSVEKYSTECVNIVLKIKQPTLELFELFFEIYSTVLLPEEIAKKFRLLGYQWLIRIFQMKETSIPLYFKHIIDKIGVFELPQLISKEEQERQLQTYVHKIIGNVLNKVQDRLQLEMGESALIYRKQKKGKYLYCFMCQKAADYYCKDTKVPVCSSECKKDHLFYISSVNIVNEQFSHQFKQSVQQLLLKNWYCARSPSLSADYLTAIYTFSLYQPQFQIQHSKIIKSPIMVEKVWLLYSSYYQKKGQMFEHVFVSFLFSQNQYLQQMAKFYFLQISQTHKILQIYYNYDLKGNLRLFPLIFKAMSQDKEYCSIFITNFVEMIFQNINPQHLRVTQKDVTLSSTLIQVFNESQSPIQALEKYFPQHQNMSTDEQIALFLMKNESLIKKQRFTKLLDKDEEFIKAFLKQITLKCKFCPIDELLREIFYFINVNVSQKIYRLLELLYEVYDFDLLGNQLQRRAIKKDDSMFQYMYLVIMLNTQLHNPNLLKKPTLSEVSERISVINKYLATEQSNKPILQSMFQRLKSLPYSQQTRGILHHYETYQFKMFSLEDFYLPLMILENSQPIHETFTKIPMSNTILYRVCSILSGFPQIQKIFFKFLLQRLNDSQNQDEYLLQAIRNILQQQPNAVNIQGGWQIIFNYIKETDIKRKKLQKIATSQGQNPHKIEDLATFPTQPLSATSIQGQKRRRRIFEPFNPQSRFSLNQISGRGMIWLDLQSVIVASPSLSHDNFIYFFKDFATTFQIETYFKQYQKVIYLNRKRLNSMANGLMLSFRKIENYWIGMKMLQVIAGLQEIEMQIEKSQDLELTESKILMSKKTSMSHIKSQLILLMLKEIPSSDTTQPLFLQTIITLSNTPNFFISSQLWESITHLALKFKSQENQAIIQDLMKRHGSCQEYYESLMIQKTLNSTHPDLINKDVLTKLDKLQPYLNDLSQKVLEMFIIKENLPTIQRNLQKFTIFKETFILFKQNYLALSNIQKVECYLTQKLQQAILHQIHLQSLLSSQFLDFLVQDFGKRYPQKSQNNLMKRYSDYLSLCISVTSFDQKTSLDKSVIFYEASIALYLMGMRIGQKIRKQKISSVKWLADHVKMLSEFCQKLNESIEYRMKLSQTYTFKHIIQYHQSQIHGPYLIGLTKQFISCNKLIWTIIESENNLSESLLFLKSLIQKLSESYDSILNEVQDFNKSLSQILDQKTIDQIFTKLKGKALHFKKYLQFSFNFLFQFNQKSKQKSTNQQEVSAFWKECRNFLMKLLFNGVFIVQFRHSSVKSSEKKTYLPRQIIKQEPLSSYLENLSQNKENIKKLIEQKFKQNDAS